MKRNLLSSPRLLEFKKQKRKVFLTKVVASPFIFSALFIGLAYVARIPSSNINAIEILGNKVLDTEILEAAARAEITENYLWFLPKSNVLLYPKSSIKRTLLNKFKRIKEVEVTLKNKQTLQISISERTPSYTWCGNVIPETHINEKCYFLDDAGFIFDQAPYFSGEVYFKFYGSLENFEKLVSLKNTLEAMKLKPVALYTKEDGDVKIFLSTTSESRPEILLTSNADFEKVAENLQTALDTEPLKSNFKNKYSSLEYIDLRFGNKVYYKFR